MAIKSLKGKASMHAKFEISADLTMVYNFASQHMASAIKFALLANDIEQNNSIEKNEASIEDIRAYVSWILFLTAVSYRERYWTAKS